MDKCTTQYRNTRFIFGVLVMLIPISSIAAIAESCLNYCFSTCSIQEKAPLDCFDKCLRTCPVDCGTVDTECAKKSVAKLLSEKRTAINESDRQGIALQSLAEGCRVKPVCERPSSKSLIAPPQLPEPDKLNRYEPAGKYFSVLVPASWEQKEYNFLKEHGLYELKIWPPGTQGMEFVLIEVNYYSGIEKSLERYIFDKLNPAVSTLGEIRGSVKDLPSLGIGGKTFEIASDRYPPLGIEANKVAVKREYFLYPMSQGFAVLVYDAPLALAVKYRPYFERVLMSFKAKNPDKSISNTLPEISDDEYKVYSDFFATGKETGKKDYAEYFSYVQDARVVSGKTTGKLNDGFLKIIQREFSDYDAILIEDYKKNNASEFMIKDKVLVRGLSIAENRNTSHFLADSRGQERISSQKQTILFDGIVALSRIGFDIEKNTALFSVTYSGGGPSTGYFVLMTKSQGKWNVQKVVMNRFVIH